jgi:hypothetical protein
MSNPKFEMPQEAADAITVANLQQWRDYLSEELEKYRANPKDELNPDGVWMHPEDVVGNEKYIRACNLLILAFGGNV